jgi:uncharacterized protein YggE
MKGFPVILNIVLASLLVIVLFAFNLPNPGVQLVSASQSTPEVQPVCDAKRTVEVTGSATVKVIPDRAQIQLGVQSNGSTPSAVQNINSQAIQKVIKTLQSLGVLSKDITTDWYIIEPVYESYDSLYIKGYRINNVVAITLRDVSQTSEVIARALEAGANQVINVEFYTSELRKYRDQARDLAMKAASEKAQALAAAAATGTGCVLTITENSWSYYNGGWYGRDRNLWSQNVTQNASSTGMPGDATGDEPISLGQISVKAEVNVTFSLK